VKSLPLFNNLLKLHLLSVAFKAGLLNSSPRDPLLCILCMSPLFNTPDSDPQLTEDLNQVC